MQEEEEEGRGRKTPFNQIQRFQNLSESKRRSVLVIY
jgi:hypothetical protein